ncbi:MAG: hypothetical protein PHT59_07910 [Candidatus Omnitrophica bacterium]|nr:hypothetical protein [Candidatus Omnitrophota bacterium]
MENKHTMAEEYRLEQARKLLRDLGYIEQPDGNFRKPVQQQPVEVQIDMDHPVLQDTPEG